ncbi:ABC transporter substrate-binding protein [Rhizobiaceae bacterium BDR2-2]|uniref:ABC transporter substrate-binding protein n=1 Tax=Ectorhizobium quercum TaxID=2965071 RepID=A0AAE3MZU9_9HYPH|nr:ABC transporter substrate-binding protein [Ectorhizobium quercum]MCX8997506.1 ABC transporter substrate-binding protein [Ectorhizobium quercum]
MTKLIAMSFLAACGGLMATSALAQDGCGRVTIAEMNWASAGVAAWVDKVILEEGYGCTVDLVSGDTMPTFTSMNEKGEPDVAPELWVNSVKDPLANAVSEGRLIEAARILEEGGVEGWWIPAYVAEAHPEITSVEKALEHPELFPAPERPERGAVMNCPAGWSCQITTANLYRALKAGEKGFDLVDSGSSAGLDGSIANAYERKQGWLGYYWSPTAILGKYDMVKLPFEKPLDRKEFDECTVVADCADPQVTSYPTADVFTVVTKSFAEKNAIAMDYLGKRSWKNDVVNEILAWQDENQATNEDAAFHFLETKPEIWKAWLAPDVAQQVEDAI